MSEIILFEKRVPYKGVYVESIKLFGKDGKNLAREVWLFGRAKLAGYVPIDDEELARILNATTENNIRRIHIEDGSESTPRLPAP